MQPAVSRRPEIAENTDILPEIELANRVLQGLSAAYLLLSASRNAPVHEIDAALERIADWQGELHEAVNSGDRELRLQLIPISTALGSLLGELRSILRSSSQEGAAPKFQSAARRLRDATAAVDRLSATRQLRFDFSAGCCAADIQHLSETRSHA